MPWLFDPETSGGETSCPTLEPTVNVSAVNHDAFPALAIANNGTHIIAYREGAGHVSTDGIIRVRTSTDNGTTWSAPTTVFSDASYDLRDPSLTKLASGRIVLVAPAWTPGGPNLDAGFTLYSDDHGATWSTPAQIDDSFTDFSRPGPVLELGNGDWLMPVYGEDTGDTHTSVRVFTSADDGATWSVTGEVADGETDSRQYNESGMIRSSSQIIILIRENTSDTGGGSGYNIWRAVSTDSGATWSTLTLVLTAHGGWPKPFLRANGDVVCLFRDVQSATVFPAKLSRSTDLGQTWEDCETFTGNRSVYGQPVEDLNDKLCVVWAVEDGAGATGSSDVFFRRETAVIVSLSIDDLTDVDTSTVAPTDGQVLKWDNTAGLWEPGDDLTGGGGGGTSSGEILISDTPSTPLVFADLLQNEAQDDLVYAD